MKSEGILVIMPRRTSQRTSSRMSIFYITKEKMRMYITFCTIQFFYILFRHFFCEICHFCRLLLSFTQRMLFYILFLSFWWHMKPKKNDAFFSILFKRRENNVKNVEFFSKACKECCILFKRTEKNLKNVAFFSKNR